MTQPKSRFGRQKRIELIRKAEARFAPMLSMSAGEKGFVFVEDSEDLVPGARTTAVLPLAGFVELFGGLLDAGIFSAERYRWLNNDKGFGIPDGFFDLMKEAGCLE